MPRTMRPYGTSFDHDQTSRGIGTASVTDTQTTTLMTPAVGARVLRWGLYNTVIGVGNDPVVCKLVQINDTDNSKYLASLTCTPDLATADTNFVSYGPGAGGGAGFPTTEEGGLLEIDVALSGAADSFVTESNSYTVWVLWSL